jgi:hypothetical protein
MWTLQTGAISPCRRIRRLLNQISVWEDQVQWLQVEASMADSEPNNPFEEKSPTTVLKCIRPRQQKNFPRVVSSV